MNDDLTAIFLAYLDGLLTVDHRARLGHLLLVPEGPMESLQREVVLEELTVQFQLDDSWLTEIGPVDDPQLVFFGL